MRHSVVFRLSSLTRVGFVTKRPKLGSRDFLNCETPQHFARLMSFEGDFLGLKLGWVIMTSRYILETVRDSANLTIIH